MQFTYQGQTYTYTIVRKRMKNIILHVRRDGTVYVSAPPAAPETVIHRFVEENGARLAARITDVTRSRQAEPDFTDGSQIPHLGEPVTLHYSDRPCPTVLTDGVLTLFARTPEEARLSHRRWLVEECVALYKCINREVSSAFIQAGYDVPLARIEIKEMRSRWGSCTARTGRISMNFRLMQYPLGCIYGVFYHEYAHFIHMDHSPAFYAVVRQLYPDYDRYDAILKRKEK